MGVGVQQLSDDDYLQISARFWYDEQALAAMLAKRGLQSIKLPANLDSDFFYLN